MCRRGPLAFADDGQSGAVNDEVQAGARAGAPKREGEMLTASRERGVIGGREIDAQPPEDRGQEALGLTHRSVEEETERQGGFDGEIGILELPAPPADASRCPRGDRVRREPEGDVASPHEGSVVLGPVPDAIRCLVLRMHSRLHIEIMTRRRSRWSTCRPLLAHRAESAHQRPLPPSRITVALQRARGRCRVGVYPGEHLADTWDYFSIHGSAQRSVATLTQLRHVPSRSESRSSKSPCPVPEESETVGRPSRTLTSFVEEYDGAAHRRSSPRGGEVSIITTG